MFFKVTSGRFLKQLRALVAQYSQGHIAFRIRVPEEMAWWYWQEFGTAMFSEKDSPNPNGYYVPRTENVDAKILFFYDKSGKAVYVKEVFVLGTPAKHMVEKALPDIRLRIQEDVARALKESKNDRAHLMQVLESETMPAIKELIRQSFYTNLSDAHRERGRLDTSPGIEFDAKAVIVNLSN